LLDSLFISFFSVLHEFILIFTTLKYAQRWSKEEIKKETYINSHFVQSYSCTNDGTFGHRKVIALFTWHPSARFLLTGYFPHPRCSPDWEPAWAPSASAYFPLSTRFLIPLNYFIIHTYVNVYRCDVRKFISSEFREPAISCQQTDEGRERGGGERTAWRRGGRREYSHTIDISRDVRSSSPQVCSSQLQFVSETRMNERSIWKPPIRDAHFHFY